MKFLLYVQLEIDPIDFRDGNIQWKRKDEIDSILHSAINDIGSVDFERKDYRIKNINTRMPKGYKTYNH